MRAVPRIVRFAALRTDVLAPEVARRWLPLARPLVAAIIAASVSTLRGGTGAPKASHELGKVLHLLQGRGRLHALLHQVHIGLRLELLAGVVRVELPGGREVVSGGIHRSRRLSFVGSPKRAC